MKDSIASKIEELLKRWGITEELGFRYKLATSILKVVEKEKAKWMEDDGCVATCQEVALLRKKIEEVKDTCADIIDDSITEERKRLVGEIEALKISIYDKGPWRAVPIYNSAIDKVLKTIRNEETDKTL